jgi:hypothetical protein
MAPPTMLTIGGKIGAEMGGFLSLETEKVYVRVAAICGTMKLSGRSFFAWSFLRWEI